VVCIINQSRKGFHLLEQAFFYSFAICLGADGRALALKFDKEAKKIEIFQYSGVFFQKLNNKR
jgi:hypothetical protein